MKYLESNIFNCKNKRLKPIYDIMFNFVSLSSDRFIRKTINLDNGLTYFTSDIGVTMHDMIQSYCVKKDGYERP